MRKTKSVGAYYDSIKKDYYVVLFREYDKKFSVYKLVEDKWVAVKVKGANKLYCPPTKSPHEAEVCLKGLRLELPYLSHHNYIWSFFPTPENIFTSLRKRG